MTYEDVKYWIRTNYTDVEIICSRETSTPELHLYSGDITISFIEFTAPSFHYITNDKSTSKYIVCNTYKDDNLNILALLHELGHHTTDQKDIPYELKYNFSKKNEVFYNEINAWEGCKSFCEELGILWDVAFAKDMFMTYVDYFGANKYCHSLMKSVGFLSEDEFNKMYKTLKINKPLFGVESWRNK